MPMNPRIRPVSRTYVRFRGAVWPRTNIRLAPHCPKCRYSLRGLAGQSVGKCPECGTSLAQHHFTGLHRVRSLRAWVVTACGPLAVASATMAALTRLDSAATAPERESVGVFASAVIVCVAAASAGTTLALARKLSAGCPRTIRSINWGRAMLAVLLLGIATIISFVLVPPSG
jgi:hypothetical protein